MIMTKNSLALLIVLAVVVVVGGLAWQATTKITPPDTTPEPVATTTPELTTLKVYFGNEVENPGALDCSKVYAVVRTVPKTEAVAQAAIEQLLTGPNAEEKRRGYFSALNPGAKLNSVAVREGIAYADFNSELGREVGGACLVTAIRAQIGETLKQFPTVTGVVISINGQSEDILQP